jgi:type I restriction enzyme R subunit
MSFTEAKLESLIIDLLQKKGFEHLNGKTIERDLSEVLLKDDLRDFLHVRYRHKGITANEIEQVIRNLEQLPSSDLYASNKTFMEWLSDGFVLKREHAAEKDIYIQLLDYGIVHRSNQAVDVVSEPLHLAAEDPYLDYSMDRNIYRIINQLQIQYQEKRIPDGILYINGLPLVVFEFKSAIREEATLFDAYKQLSIRYHRDIPELFKYNAFCIISDGVNSKMGSFFSKYDFYYAWRKVSGYENDVMGIDSLFSMIDGVFEPKRLLDIIQNFIYLPDSSNKEEKIICRYPQYYAARKLFHNILLHQKPAGDGKGGTYFGTTGCGKSYTMLFLARLVMKSPLFSSPTIVLITDRTDLDDQLSAQFTNAMGFIGDNEIVSVESRKALREKLQGRNSGGVFLTTIHKFTEDSKLLTNRSNVICISDEAHRSQVNLDQKIRITDKGVNKTYSFAKYLHDSLPNATYVGFTGTPIDATLDVFGEIVDSYTMTESVKDEITVRIVYEGRAAKVLLNNSKLKEIEDYYNQCAEEGSNDYQIESSKKAMAQLSTIIGDPDRLKALAEDFVKHYEQRVSEGATVAGKALFVSSSREIAYKLYQCILALRPDWGEVRAADPSAVLNEKDQKEILPAAKIQLVMTRGKDDPEKLYHLLGNKAHRKELDRQFKNIKSNFKIALVVDMWLTGFDVPFLDTIYIDKPIQRHNLIQTISRVNRKFEGKEKGLVVDYIGIKKQMNLALAQYNKVDSQNFEDVEQSIVVVRDHLDLLSRLFLKFDSKGYFEGSPMQQLNTLNMAAEYVQLTKDMEKRFMNLVKRMKAAYDICSGAEAITQEEKNHIHFYMAVRAIVYKLLKGEAPDTAQMNAKVKDMIQAAIESEGVEEIFKLGDDKQKEVDIFDEDYLLKIDKIKLPHTKIKLLQKLLAKAIDEFKKVNRTKGVDFSKKMQVLVDKYNERKETDILVSNVLEDFTDEIIDLYHQLRKEKDSFKDLGIDFEEKAFYDILKALAVKYDFTYPDDRLLTLAKEVKTVVDDKAKYTDWSKREDIKAELKVDLIILLAENDYPPVDRDEVYKEIFEQAENFKKYKSAL